MSPTARTLGYLRQRGYLAGVVEQRVPHTFITRDLLGFADVLAVHADVPGALFVQVTSGANHAARRKKLAALAAVATVLAAQNRVEIHSWRKSARTRRWACRVEAVPGTSLADVERPDLPPAP
jgi:uncharacterized membrane protein YqiK